MEVASQRYRRRHVDTHVALQAAPAEIGAHIVFEHGRVVDQAIRHAQAGGAALDQCVDGGFVGQVSLQGNRAAARLPDLRDRALGLLGGAAEMYRDIPARSGQVQGNDAPKAPGAAGDQGDLVFGLHALPVLGVEITSRTLGTGPCQA